MDLSTPTVSPLRQRMLDDVRTRRNFTHAAGFDPGRRPPAARRKRQLARAAVIQRLSDLVQDAAATPRVREINKTFGMPEKPWTAGELARIDGVDKPIWIALAQELNIALD